MYNNNNVSIEHLFYWTKKSLFLDLNQFKLKDNNVILYFKK